MLRRWAPFVLAVLFVCLFTTPSGFGAPAATAKNSATVAASRVPLYFEANQGQTSGEVRYVARAGGYTAFLTSHDVVLDYGSGRTGPGDGRDAVVHMRLAGAQEPSAIHGSEPLAGVVNYLIGNDPSKWHTRIPTFGEVDYDKVYPGVDLEYRPAGKQLEFEFHVAAGADPDPIRIEYSGASGMHLNAAGDLVLNTSAGPASVLKPIGYQDVDGRRVPVAVKFALLRGGEVGFKLGRYDHSKSLVIDPTVGPSSYYSTYLGSGQGDTFKGIAVDAAGEAFICGSTSSTSYPIAAPSGFSPYQSTIPANYIANFVSAAFVTKLNAAGTGLVYSTFISGNGNSANVGAQLNSIAVDANGNAFAGGETDDSTFPIVRAFQPTFPSSRTVYSIATGMVFELSADGNSLVYSSFIGGGDSDTVTGIAVDTSDNAYITGTNFVQGNVNTTSGFPVTSGAIWGHFSQPNIGAGFNDSFASKISPPTTGNATLAYSTVIGSATDETPSTTAQAIAVDSNGDAYVTGWTNANIEDHGGTITTKYNMPNVTVNPTEYVINVWVLELNPSGGSAIYLDYLGGNAPSGTYSPQTTVAGIAVDSTGQAYVAGVTEATNFQTTSGAYQASPRLAGITNTTTNTEQSDGFVTVIAAGGGSLTYSSYLNGTTISATALAGDYDGSLQVGGIALGTGGQFAVSGLVDTTDFPATTTGGGVPLLNAYPGCPGSCASAVGFITKFSSTGSLLYSTFVGNGNEYGVNGVASNGTDVYAMLAESDTDNNYALTTGGAYNIDNSSGVDELIVRVQDAVPTSTTVSVDSASAPTSSSAQTVSLSSSVSAPSAVNGGVVQYVVTNASSQKVGSTVTSGIVANGVAPATSFTLPANTAAGAYTITANYIAAADFLRSAGTGTLTIGASAATTATGVVASTNPTSYGQSVNFLATVTDTSTTAVPTGSVQFVVDGVNFGSPVALSGVSSNRSQASSQATSTLSTSGSPHTVAANYINSDGNFTASSASLSGGQIVNPAATTTAVASSGNASVYGQAVTFTATVTDSSTTVPPTGAVQFVVDGVNFGSPVALTASGSKSSAATSAATSTLSTTGSPHSVSVNYTNTDGNFSNSSTTLSGGQTVNAATPAFSGLSASQTITYGQTGSITVSGTLSVTTPSESPSGGTVNIAIGTASAPAAIGSNGAFITTVGVSALSASATPYAISYSYAGTTNFNAASNSSTTLTINKGTQTALSVTGVPGTAQTYGATFTVGSTGGSGTGAVTFSAGGACSVAGVTVTMTSGTGTCSVTATKATDTNYNSATSTPASVGAALATQAALTVTGVPGTAQHYGATFTVGSGGGSGTGAVAFAGIGACTVAGTTVSMTSGTGTCSVSATKAADTNYASAASGASTVSAALATQSALTVTGVPGTAQAYGATFTVSSSGGNGTGAVTFAASGACSVAGATVTMTSGTGTCSVSATKAADTNYASAASAASTVGAALAAQSTLTVTGVPGTAQAYGATFTLASSGGSGTGAVTFAASGACSVAGTTVTMTSGTGTCTVSATKAADNNYASDTSAAATVSAALAAQTALTVTGVPGTAQAYGATFSISSSGGSGTGAVTFAASGACSVAGNTVTMTSGTGTCTVSATKAADLNYASSTSAAATVSAALAAQTALTVTGVPGAAQAYGATFTIASNGGSGTGAVTFAASGACSVAGTTVTMTSGTGTCTVSATKAADLNYASSTSAAATVSAALAAQTALTVTGVPGAAQAYGATFSVGSNGGSGTGAVSFSASGACSVTGTTVTMTSGTGTCTVTATKAADLNYASVSSAASTVSAALAAQATLTVTGVPMVAQHYGTAFTVGTSGGSGTGAVSFAASGACAVAGSKVTMTNGTGSCSVSAAKAADLNYASAASAASTVSASLAAQATLNVTGVPTNAQHYGTTFTVGTSGGSGTGAVTFSASGACSVADATVTMISGVGTCSVSATKAADTDYAGATSAAATVAATLAAQSTLTVTGVPATAQSFGTEFAVGTSGGSGTGAVTFSARGACSVSASTVTMINGTGTCTVTASKAADSDYASESSSPAAVLAALARQEALNMTVPRTLTFGATGKATATGGSGTGAIAFASTGSTGCTIGGSTGVISVTDASGTCELTATKAANTDFSAITSATYKVALVKAGITSAILETSAPAVLLSNDVTLTFRATYASGTATGTVMFMDSSAALGSGALDTTGTATLTINTLAAGAHTLTAVYGGDSNFNAITSAAVSETVEDFAFNIEGGSATATVATVTPGGTATYTLQVKPTEGATFPNALKLTLSGLPPGASYTITPATIAAGSGTTTVTVEVSTAGLSSNVKTPGKLPPALAFALLLPFFGIRRIRRALTGNAKRGAMIFCLLLGLAAMGMSACGGKSGFLNQAQQTYTLELTAKSGTLEHSQPLKLTIQ